MNKRLLFLFLISLISTNVFSMKQKPKYYITAPEDKWLETSCEPHVIRASHDGNGLLIVRKHEGIFNESCGENEVEVEDLDDRGKVCVSREDYLELPADYSGGLGKLGDGGYVYMLHKYFSKLRKIIDETFELSVALFDYYEDSHELGKAREKILKKRERDDCPYLKPKKRDKPSGKRDNRKKKKKKK